MHPSTYYRRTHRLVYLDLARPVALDDLHAALLAIAEEERWKTGLGDNRWSYLSRAVLAAVRAGVAPADDLRLGLELLPLHAPPPDGASSVRKTLSLLLGRPLAQKRRGHQLDRARYQPLVDVLALRGDKSVRLANLDLALRAAGYGTRAPAVMPDRKALLAAAKRIEMPEPTINAAIVTYMQAREALLPLHPELASAFAPIVGGHGRVIGIESLPVATLAPLLEAAGITTHPSEVPWLEIVRVVAPILHEEYTRWLADPRRCERPGLVTPAGQYAIGRALNKLVAGLIRAERVERLRTLSLLDLWSPSEPPFDAEAELDPMVQRARERSGRAGIAVRHQPVRVGMDAMAPLSRALAGVEATEGYVVSAVRNVQNLWTLTGGAYKHLFLRDDPEPWLELKRAYDATIALFCGEMLEPAAERDKDKLLELVSLPQLVCVGFPLLELARQRARRDWLEAVAVARAAGHDPAVVPAVKQAHRAYADAAELRLAPGVYVADGLRLANYRWGLLGAHYQLTFSHEATGRANGIAAVRTEWTGDREDPAKTKRESEPGGTGRGRGGRRRRRNARTMTGWRSALVPPDALWEYLDEVTLPRVIAAGQLPADATVEDLVAAKRFPMFATTKAFLGTGGPLGTTTLSIDRVGKALWWTAKHGLGRDLPEWEALDRAQEFYRIFVGHDTRLLNTCYWGKVMGDYVYAGWLTNARPDTLRSFYDADAYARWDEKAGDRNHWDHPHAFDKWMLDIREYRLNAVDLGDPALPLPGAARALLAQWAAADRTARGGRRGKRARPAGRIRRARPGQPAPGSAVALAPA